MVLRSARTWVAVKQSGSRDNAVTKSKSITIKSPGTTNGISSMNLSIIRWICFGICILAVCSSKICAQAVSGLSAVRVAFGLTRPVFVTAPPGDTRRLFIVRQTGQVHILNLATGKLNTTPFLDIHTRLTSTSGEQGLLGMAFDPNYTTNGKFFLNFTVPGGTWGRRPAAPRCMTASPQAHLRCAGRGCPDA